MPTVTRQRTAKNPDGAWKGDGVVKTTNAEHQLREAQELIRITPPSEWQTLRKTSLYLVARAHQAPDEPKLSTKLSQEELADWLRVSLCRAYCSR